MRHLLIALALVALGIPFVQTAADVPEFMSYQGLLRDGVGDPVPDGDYSVTFRLYDVETGGTALWEETQTVTVADGVFNAKLGRVAPFTEGMFEVPYWLGISVVGDPELAPRVELASVPYAGHAAFADRCDENDDDWQINGDNIYHEVGNVGIGVSTMDAKLDVLVGDALCADFSNGSSEGNFTIRARNYGATAGGFYAGILDSPYPEVGAAVYGVGGAGHRGGHFVTEDESGDALRAETIGNGPAIRGVTWGTGYAGYFEGGSGVFVDGQVDVAAFKMPTGAVAGWVLTSDGSGVGTWQPVIGPAAAREGAAVTAGGNVVLDESGQAWVELPEAVELSAGDLRYQLTAIGTPGPNLYVAEKVSGGRFRIAGGKPGAEVSWQVKGAQ